MKRTAWANVLLTVSLAVVPGCKTPGTRPDREPPPPEIEPTVITYVETEAFDVLFESALLNQDPVVVVQTDFDKPEWGHRLNAWIAAWNMGGKLPAGRRARGQAPIPKVVVDGDSLREFRLLIGGLMDRIEDYARDGSAWWAEERTRSRRVALLKPYNLRFHMDDDMHILLIFFHGDHADHYPKMMKSLTGTDMGEPELWTRTFECSHCKECQKAKGAPGILTGGGSSGE